MRKINSLGGFERWAISEHGEKWYIEPKILATYGIEQLTKLFDIDYSKENIVPEEDGLELAFTKSQVNHAMVKARSKGEFQSIVKNDQTGRSNKQILEDCIQGQYAEQYLIDIGFNNCHEKYHDLVDRNGNITEVKAYSTRAGLDEQFERIKNADWNHSVRMIGFLVREEKYYPYFDKLFENS